MEKDTKEKVTRFTRSDSRNPFSRKLDPGLRYTDLTKYIDPTRK